jgi:hypothetical protein
LFVAPGSSAFISVVDKELPLPGEEALPTGDGAEIVVPGVHPGSNANTIVLLGPIVAPILE